MIQLICPVCGETLTRAERAYVCPNSHSFDVAREGYVNLLLSRSRGDTREMLLARRRFLARCYYAPLAQAIGEAVLADYQTDGDALTVLDAGCGEGYYLGYLRDLLDSSLPIGPHYYLGLDISKDAIRLAAKAYPDMQFVVADTTKIPIADDSINVLLDVFAPRNAPEFARTLTPGGLLLLAVPTPDHLAELRARLPLLGIEEQKEQHVITQFAEGFAMTATRRIHSEVELDAEAIIDLVTMTPSYRHVPDNWQASVQEFAPLRTTLDFTLLVFRRHDN